MKKLIFLFALLVGGLMATGQPLQRTVFKATQYLQSDTLKSINATSVSLDGNRITDVADPVNPQDAVNKQTLDAAVLAAGGGDVTSVNGQTGDVVLDLDAKADSVWVLSKNYLTAIPATYVQTGDNVSEMVNDAGYLTVETDDQTLSIDSIARRFTISIEGGNSVSFEDQNTDSQTAAQVPYTNTTSGLSATDVQAAVDELDAAIEAAASGGVVSINGETGIVVIDTDDISEGATNEYYTEAKVAANSAVALNTAKVTNATHTGEVTGSGALTIANGVVDYAKVSSELAGQITDNDGVWDWSAAGLINAAISTNTTVTFSNLQIVKQLRIHLTLSAGATITWPAYVTVQGDELGDGSFKLYADCWNSGSGTEDVFINIIAE